MDNCYYVGIFTGRTRSAMKVISLQKKVSDLEDKVVSTFKNMSDLLLSMDNLSITNA